MNMKASNNKLILIVEDEIPLIKVLVQKLELEGFRTITAKNGKQGLKMGMWRYHLTLR